MLGKIGYIAIAFVCLGVVVTIIAARAFQVAARDDDESEF